MGLRTVGLGLHLVLLGKVVMVLTMMVALRHPSLLSTKPVFALSLTIGALVTLGHALCWPAAVRSGSRGSLAGALGCNLLGNVLHVCAQCWFGGLPLRLTALTLKWFSFILFMMFMVALAGWLERRDLFWMVHWHRGLLVVGFVLAVLGGPLPFVVHGVGFEAATPLGMAVIVLGLAAYVGLIVRLTLSVRRVTA